MKINVLHLVVQKLKSCGEIDKEVFIYEKNFLPYLFFFTGFFLFATERLIVNNIEVKDFKNPTNILGDGTAVFDPETSTLTLNKATLTKGAEGKGLEISGGTLSVCMTGKNPGGALMMDKNGLLTLAQGATHYEGNSEPGALVKALTWSKGLSKETKRIIKIVVNAGI